MQWGPLYGAVVLTPSLLCLCVLIRQRAVSLRRGSKSKKAKKSSAVITRPKLGVSKLSKSRRNNAGVKKKGGVKRRGGVQQTHKGRATVPIPTPSGVESSAVEEKEGLLQGSRPKEGKEGSGQKKKKQLVGKGSHQHSLKWREECVVYVRCVACRSVTVAAVMINLRTPTDRPAQRG